MQCNILYRNLTYISKETLCRRYNDVQYCTCRFMRIKATQKADFLQRVKLIAFYHYIN